MAHMMPMCYEVADVAKDSVFKAFTLRMRVVWHRLGKSGSCEP